MATQKIDDAYVNWLLSSAHSYLGQKMASQAITLLELLHALCPDNQQALRMLVYAYLLAAQYEQVLETATVLEGLNKIDEEQIAYLSLLRSRALWGLGNAEASQDEFKKYIRTVAVLKPQASKQGNE